MRRQDKRADETKALQIIQNCDVCRIALCQENIPYIVPMNFGYSFEEHELVLYFHCAGEGRKIEMIKQNNRACFEMDCCHKLNFSDVACNCSMGYESVIGEGTIEILSDREEKIKGLTCMMEHYGGKGTYEFADKRVDGVTVLKLTVHTFDAKVSQKSE